VRSRQAVRRQFQPSMAQATVGNEKSTTHTSMPFDPPRLLPRHLRSNLSGIAFANGNATRGGDCQPLRPVKSRSLPRPCRARPRAPPLAAGPPPSRPSPSCLSRPRPDAREGTGGGPRAPSPGRRGASPSAPRHPATGDRRGRGGR